MGLEPTSPRLWSVSQLKPRPSLGFKELCLQIFVSSLYWNPNGAPSPLDVSTCPGWKPTAFCTALKYYLSSQASLFSSWISAAITALLMYDEVPSDSILVKPIKTKIFCNLEWGFSKVGSRTRILASRNSSNIFKADLRSKLQSQENIRDRLV